MAPIDDGVAVHYTALETGTPVYSAEETHVAKVVEVLDNLPEHIFDGLVIETEDGVWRFVDAPEVTRTAERGVTLSLTAEEVAGLAPPPAGPGPGGAVRKLFGGLKRR